MSAEDVRWSGMSTLDFPAPYPPAARMRTHADAGSPQGIQLCGWEGQEGGPARRVAVARAERGARSNAVCGATLQEVEQ